MPSATTASSMIFLTFTPHDEIFSRSSWYLARAAPRIFPSQAKSSLKGSALGSRNSISIDSLNRRKA
jgi:hypothetical protein